MRLIIITLFALVPLVTFAQRVPYDKNDVDSFVIDDDTIGSGDNDDIFGDNQGQSNNSSTPSEPTETNNETNNTSNTSQESSNQVNSENTSSETSQANNTSDSSEPDSNSSETSDTASNSSQSSSSNNTSPNTSSNTNSSEGPNSSNDNEPSSDQSSDGEFGSSSSQTEGDNTSNSSNTSNNGETNSTDSSTSNNNTGNTNSTQNNNTNSNTVDTVSDEPAPSVSSPTPSSNQENEVVEENSSGLLDTLFNLVGISNNNQKQESNKTEVNTVVSVNISDNAAIALKGASQTDTQIALEEIKTNQDLALFVQHHIVANPSIKNAVVTEQRIQTQYQQPGRLFGFFPIRYTQSVEVNFSDKMTLDGVSIKKPWFSIFIAGDNTRGLEIEIKKQIEEILSEGGEVSEDDIQGLLQRLGSLFSKLIDLLRAFGQGLIG